MQLSTRQQMTRRFFLGIGIGGLGTAILLWLVSQSKISGEASATVIETLGGELSLFVAGTWIGVIAAFFFRPLSSQMDQLIGGVIVGMLTWTTLTLNLLPVILGHAPLWQAADVAPLLPQLLFALLQGGLIGLIYGVAHNKLAGRLGLTELAPTVSEIKTRVVILGGGYAGVSAAQALDHELRKMPEVAVTLVSNTNFLLHTPMLSEVSASAVNGQNISPPLRSFFQHVQLVQGEVEQIDLARHTVHLSSDHRSGSRHLSFDHLVLTMGSIPNFFGNKGIEERAFTFKSLEDADLIRNQVIDMFERADFEPDAEVRRRLLTFVVAGGGFAGVELIGGLNDFARGIAPFYPNINPDEIRLVLVHSRDTILPELSASLGLYAQQKLEERGVEFMLGTRCTGADASMVYLSNNQIPSETFIWTAGNQPNPALKTLGMPLTERGTVAVNEFLHVPGRPTLWAAGDCAEVPDLLTGKSAPPTAQYALREGKVLGKNIAATILGKSLHPFKHRTQGSLAALGHQLAVAEVFGYRFSGFLAWVMWRAIYLGKLPTFSRQVRVGLDWLLDLFFPPDIVQTIDFSRKQRLEKQD